MPYRSKVILQLPLSDPGMLAPFVGDGSDRARFIATTAHPSEPLDLVVRFATIWTGDGARAEAPEIVRL